MSVLAIIALISGILGVLFTIMQRIWCWPMALISVVTSSIEFYNEHLFGDMALQVFYFIAGVYGWWYWNENQGSANSPSKKEFNVTTTPLKMWFIMIIATLVQGIIYYFLLKRFKGDQVMFDAILTACSITATYMMTKKWLENWVCWIAIDGAYVVLYLIKQMPLFALLYFVFTAMSVYGFYKWRIQRS
jgi:nicotinamide mononucleotide transporter